MILKREVLELAKAQGIEPRMIEKDYVLGWVLAGINNHSALKEKWIFKGGTALKKCYFDKYRFSEDLDFTVIEPSHINDSFLQSTFLEVLEWVRDESGIEIAVNQTKFDTHPDSIKQYVTGYIYYTGPLGQRGNLNKILLDILSNEILVLETDKREIYHGYTDKSTECFYAHCYCLEELFAEKIRAMMERARPRDLYDIVHLYWNQKLLINKSILLSTLQKKCEFKGVLIPRLDAIYNHPKFNELKAEWDNMLSHQVHNLPTIDIFLRELKYLFNWLENF